MFMYCAECACSETFSLKWKISSVCNLSIEKVKYLSTLFVKRRQYGGLIIIFQFIVFLYPLLVVLRRSGTKKVENLRNRWFVSWPIEPSCFLLTPSLTQVVFMWRMFLLEKSDSQLGPKPRLLQCGKNWQNISMKITRYEKSQYYLQKLIVLFGSVLKCKNSIFECFATIFKHFITVENFKQ